MEQEFVLFRVSSRFCALPLEHVEETMRPLPLEVLPQTPPFVLGASLIRGAPAPVVDLGVVLTGQKLVGAERVITVRTTEGRRVALLVSAVMGCGTLDEASSRAMPPLLHDAASGAVATLGRIDRNLLTILQVGRLVPEEVWSRLGRPTGNA